MKSDPRLDRRALLVLGAGLLAGLVGCDSEPRIRRPRSTSDSPPSFPIPTPSQTSGATAVRPSPDTSRLPRFVSWQPDPGDLQPAAKVAAARVVEALGTWDGDEGTTSAAAHRLRRLGFRPALANAAGPLLGPESDAVVQVTEAQYGGLLPTTCSVLVVCRQQRAGDDAVVRGGATIDVRLSKASRTWEVTSLHVGRPAPARRALPSLAARVLANQRIVLPVAAAADVASGIVHDSVLQAMLELSAVQPIGVSVLRSGHPTYVFGTSTVSDHTRGRAFDTWWLDGHHVVHPGTPRRLITDYMTACADLGAYNVGGPYAVSRTGFFTNAAHHDHVHAGFAS